GRHRLHRHRPGRDRRDDRELSRRFRLEGDAPQPAPQARARARGVHGGMVERARRDGIPGMKRLLACALAVLGALVAGCTQRDAGPATLRFWAMGREAEVISQLLPEFERRNPGVRVVVQQLPWTAAHEKLLTAFAGDALPDICQLGNTWVPELAALGALEPLD